VIRAVPGPALRLRDVTEYFGVGSFVGEILAEEVLLLARLVHRRRWDHSSPNEEDVGVEWDCLSAELLPVLLRAEIPEE
jgi:hypothetical protein